MPSSVRCAWSSWAWWRSAEVLENRPSSASEMGRRRTSRPFFHGFSWPLGRFVPERSCAGWRGPPSAGSERLKTSVRHRSAAVARRTAWWAACDGARRRRRRWRPCSAALRASKGALGGVFEVRRHGSSLTERGKQRYGMGSWAL